MTFKLDLHSLVYGDEPVIRINGSDSWEDSYRLSGALENAGMDDAYDFVNALDCAGVDIRLLDGATVIMVQEGCNDGPNWIWWIQMVDPYSSWGRNYNFILDGWCDYTGWECRAGASMYAYTDLGLTDFKKFMDKQKEIYGN